MIESKQLGDATSFLIGAWKTRPRGRRFIRLFSFLLLVTGLGMLAYPYFTNFYTARAQSKLASEFEAPELKSLFLGKAIQPGQVLTNLRIPSLGVDTLVVEGTDPGALRGGAGHYQSTAMPCAEGNVGIAGHRTTYGKPFNQLDELRVGDSIILKTPQATCTYRVVNGPSGTPRPRATSAGWITHPDDGAVIGPMKGSFLTLTTCHPKGSAAKRLIVRAQLEEVAQGE